MGRNHIEHIAHKDLSNPYVPFVVKTFTVPSGAFVVRGITRR